MVVVLEMLVELVASVAVLGLRGFALVVRHCMVGGEVSAPLCLGWRVGATRALEPRPTAAQCNPGEVVPPRAHLGVRLDLAANGVLDVIKHVVIRSHWLVGVAVLWPLLATLALAPHGM